MHKNLQRPPTIFDYKNLSRTGLEAFLDNQKRIIVDYQDWQAQRKKSRDFSETSLIH